MSVPNPLRWAMLFVGRAMARAGVLDRERVERTTDLAWPRIVTGLARMSKNAADVAMVGIALGPAAIAGVGFGSAFWGVAFALGGGVAGGTISLVSQRYGADAHEELGLAITSSVATVLAITVPVAVVLGLFPRPFIALVGSGAGDAAVGYGADYLRIVAIGIPLAGLNLIGSRALVGADDAWTPMIARGGGAVLNIGFNAVFIFGLGMGVVGAALGTVLANGMVAATFAAGMLRGRLPGIGAFPVTVSLGRPYLDAGLLRDLVVISTPLTASNMTRRFAQFALLFFAGMFGETVAAAYVIARRVRGLLNTPGWGFSLASSSLVGQELGTGDEDTAGEYGREIIRFAVATFAIGAVFALVFARPITRVFVQDPETLPLATTFVRVAALSVVFWGVSGASTGPLRASGDTRWPFYANVIGLYGFAVPLLAVGAYTWIGLWGIYASLLAETVAPAAVNYYRFASGKWKVVSREYRPDVPAADD